MSIHGQSFRWGRSHLGKRGFRGGCRAACAEPGTAEHAADTERCSRPPSPRHCVPLERRCCGGWRWCSALSGWCGGGNSAPPTTVWRMFQQVFSDSATVTFYFSPYILWMNAFSKNVRMLSPLPNLDKRFAWWQSKSHFLGNYLKRTFASGST